MSTPDQTVNKLPFDSEAGKGDYDNVAVFVPGEKAPRSFPKEKVVLLLPGMVSVLDDDGDQITFMNVPIVIEKARGKKA